MLNDAVRSLRRAPVFSLITMAVLAIGMAAPLTAVHMFRWPYHTNLQVLVLVLLSLVLSAVCANVASLHLARGEGRRREMEIRFAIGADSSRIARQLMIENLLLSIGGGAVALWLAAMAATVLAAWSRAAGAFVRTDVPMILIAAALSLVCWAASGVGPALRAARRRRMRSPRRRRILIGLNACAGCFCLIVGGIYTEWAHALLHPPFRFDIERSYQIRNIAPEQVHATFERVRRDPATEAATISGARLGFSQMHVLDYGKRVEVNDVDPSYFAFMGSALLRGRMFRADEQYAMVAGETAARNLWPDADPLGQKITLRWYDGSSASYTVVGVVQDTGEMEILPHDRLAGQLFTVLNPAKLRLAVVLVRTRPGVVAKPDRAAVGLPDYLARTNAHSTMYATLFDFMGIAIVIVSALGVAGVLWCVVVQRARDMAIRVAIGARRRDIVRVLMAEFLLPMSVGVGTGVFLGANFWIYCGHYLQGIPIFDPVTYVGAVGVFGGIGVVGVTIAGARAWRVAPARFL